MRTCIGCRRFGPVATLVRVVRDDAGSLRLDRSGPGRGAWLCTEEENGLPAASCLEQATRRQAFSRALRTEVSAAAAAALRETVELRARIESGGTAVPHEKGLT